MASDQRSVSVSVSLATTGSVWGKGRESLDSGQGHGPSITLRLLPCPWCGTGLSFEAWFSGIASG